MGIKQRSTVVIRLHNPVLIDVLIAQIYGGGAVAQSVERASPGEEVPGWNTAVLAHSLLVGSM